MLAAVVAALVFGACGGRDANPPLGGSGSAPASAEPSPHERELLALWDFEKKRRAEIDFATHPPSDDVLGSDPYRIVRAGKHLVGLLRGESAIVLLDAEAKELSRAATPRSPTGVAVSRDGEILVVGEGAREIAQFAIDGTTLARVATLPVDALGMRGVAVSPDGKTAYVVEERQGRLLSIALAKTGRVLAAKGVTELGRCHGPIAVEAIADVVVTNCLLDRALEIRRGKSVSKIQHDGPLWSFDLLREGNGTLLLAAGGVEDHPLERADGGFGFIDSFIYLYRLDAKPVRLAAINASEHGVITPKAIELFEDGDLIGIGTSGYGGSRQVNYSWPQRAYDKPPDINAWDAPPGAAAGTFVDNGPWITANALLDAWVVHRPPNAVVVPAGKKSARGVESRIGELLFFTEMMAPWSGTEGKLSRFTCETCHHEGYIDGRTHFTGREHGGLKVHASTRPLLGLFNNAPYFSRALDETMTQMVHSEFKVANRHNGRDPWFALDHLTIKWLKLFLGVAPPRFSAEELRKAFIAFLIDFSHRRNPAADHATFTDAEKRGAQVFRDRCASCHDARLIAEDPASAVPFERWEKLVLSPSGPLVWNNAAYAKTGILPYVHDDGARVPTLRRLYKKWPYFTNGSAKSLDDVLDRFAYDAKTSLHDQAAPAPGSPATAMTRLTNDDKAAVRAFLDLL